MGKDAGDQPRARAARCTSPTRSSGSSAPTGSWPPGLPIAVGAATAAQLRADGSVAVAFFGDGAPAQGAFHEAVNLAAVWQLPVIFFCENNGYAEFSPARPSTRPRSSNGPPATASPTSRSTATTSWRPPPRWRTWSLAARAGRGPVRGRGDHLPLARPLRGRSGALPLAGGGRRVGGARPAAASTSARLREAGVGDDEVKALESSVADELDGAVEAARRLAGPGRRPP